MKIYYIIYYYNMTIRKLFKNFIDFFKCKKNKVTPIPILVEPTPEPTPEPTLEHILVEPTPEPTPEPILVEPTPEPTPEPILVEPTLEPILVEPTLEHILVEPTLEHILVEPTPEPTLVEPTPEPTLEHSREIIFEPFPEQILVEPTPIQLDYLQKSEIIEILFIEYKNKYPSFYKRKPRRPNFNENSFYGLCNKIEFTSNNDLSIILKKLNQERKISNLLHLSEVQRQKCEDIDFYLFT